MSPLVFLFSIIRGLLVYLFIIHMLTVFWISGLLLSFLQFILYVTLYNINRRLYRKIFYYLQFCIYSQIISIYEWRTNSTCKMFGDPEHLQKFGTENCLIVTNHKYDFDWMIVGYITNHLRNLSNMKACFKNSTRYLPVIGWGAVMGENMFLERNWEKDKLKLGGMLDNLASYEDPMMLNYCCEGTRFTPEKHEASVEFAKSRNLPHLRHHLLPRTKGFNFSAKHLKHRIPAVYNVQVAIPDTQVKPTLINLFKGHSFNASFYVERIPMDEVPTDSDEATSKWMYELYQRKDKLMDEFFKTHKFPGECRMVTRSYRTFINSAFWGTTIGLPLLYFVFQIMSNGNIVFVSAVSSIFLILCSMMFYAVQVTKADKSSSYGSLQKSKNAHQKENRQL